MCACVSSSGVQNGILWEKNGTSLFCTYWYTKQRLLRTHWSLYKIALVEPYDMMVEWFESPAQLMERKAKKTRTHKNHTESKGLGSVNDAVFHFHPSSNDNTFMRLWGYKYCCARPTYAFKHTQTNRPIKIMWKLDMYVIFVVVSLGKSFAFSLNRKNANAGTGKE